MILLQQALHAIAEPIVNKILAFDALSQSKLLKLEQKRLSIELADLAFRVNLQVLNGKVLLSSNLENADCFIKTSTAKLKQLSDASQLTQMIKQDQLELEGDLAVAQNFSSLFIENEIDWRELLSTYIGDAPAHKVANIVTRLADVVARKTKDMDYTLHSAIVDEVKLAPSNIEVSRYVNAVDDVAAQTERLLTTVKQVKGLL